MEGAQAVYLGNIVSKKGFRTFIYSSTGDKLLVESWEDFEDKMASGIWFASSDEAVKIKKPVKVEEDEPKELKEPKPKYKASK